MGKTQQLGTLVNGLTVDADGNVGIATTPTTDRLTISGNTTVLGSVNVSSYQYFTSIYGGYIFGYTGTTYTPMTYSASYHSFSTSGTEKLRITNSGNVGIGTTNPTEKLSVIGNIRIDNGAADGGQLVLASSGYSDWNIDNYSGRLRAYYNATEYFTITSSGNVGIGTNSPSYKLDIQSGSVGAFGSTVTAAWSNGFLNHSYFMAPNMTGGGLSIAFGKSNGTYNVAKIAYNHVADASSSNYIGLGFWDADNKLIIRADGRVGIGTTDPAYGNLSVVATDNTVVGSTEWGTSAASNLNICVYNTSQTAGTGAGIRLVTRNSGASVWGIYNISTGSGSGDLVFGNGNGGSGQERMRISSDGTLNLGTYHSNAKILPGADSNHYMRYNTSVDGIEIGGYSGIMFSTLGGSERMRIRSNGSITLGGNDFGTVYGFSFKGVTGLDCFAALSVRNNGDNIINFFNSGNGYVASISVNSSSVSYGTGSDYRLKEDLKDFDGLAKISAIKVYDFKFKQAGDRMEGVLAHELKEIIPYAVNGEKDEIDENGLPKIQNVDYSKIVPVLIKSVQQLKAEIEILKNK